MFHELLIEHAYYALWMYGIIAAVCQVWGYYRKYRERELCASQLEAELAQAQLKVLRMQLDPQFLFATFDSISSLMHEDVEAADDLIADLSDLLRMSLETMDEAEIALKREMDFVKAYLEIKQTRWRGKLKVQMTLEPDSLDAMVPGMLLPALVENAIQSGFDSSAERVRIEIRSAVRGGMLRIEILDDAPWRGETAATLSAIDHGMANAQMRLEQLHPYTHRCTREMAPGEGSRVTLEMPLKVKDDSSREQPALQTVNEES